MTLYLLYDTEKGLRVEEGTQPVGGSLSHTPYQYSIQECEPEHKVLDPFFERPVPRWARGANQFQPACGDTQGEEGESKVHQVGWLEEGVPSGGTWEGTP